MTQIESKPAAEGPFKPQREDVKATAPESPLVDVLAGVARREIRVHEHGFIALIDAMPRLVPEGKTADAAIVQAARVSYGQGTKRVNEDRGLIRYLLRHRHTTPFEMVEFKFHISMPIFIARQWIRHRTANVNEYSGRYSVMPDHFYHPTLDAVRKQSKSNRQGGSETFDTSSRAANAPTPASDSDSGSGSGPSPRPQDSKPPAKDSRPRTQDSQDPLTAASELQTAEDFLSLLDRAESLYPDYESLLESGVSRELARIALPLSTYTQWYWKCDLHNILHFLKLRMDPHAQEEIRLYAQAMHDLIEPIVPVTMEAFRDYELEAVRLSRLEVEALRDRLAGGGGALNTQNKRETREWEQKIARLTDADA